MQNTVHGDVDSYSATSHQLGTFKCGVDLLQLNRGQCFVMTGTQAEIPDVFFKPILCQVLLNITINETSVPKVAEMVHRQDK